MALIISCAIKNAEKGKYAIGAFNVYNLEGIEAVIAAAEELRSPAILQIHPSALKQGGIPLVACCISAAKQARVPITVHFDHENSKKELVEVLPLLPKIFSISTKFLPTMLNILRRLSEQGQRPASNDSQRNAALTLSNSFVDDNNNMSSSAAHAKA